MYCRIRVRGHLDPAWQGRLAALRATHEDGGSSPLAGPLPDQAILHGVLLQLIRPGLPLLALDTGEVPARAGRDSEGATAAGGGRAVARQQSRT